MAEYSKEDAMQFKAMGDFFKKGNSPHQSVVKSANFMRENGYELRPVNGHRVWVKLHGEKQSKMAKARSEK